MILLVLQLCRDLVTFIKFEKQAVELWMSPNHSNSFRLHALPNSNAVAIHMLLQRSLRSVAVVSCQKFVIL